MSRQMPTAEEDLLRSLAEWAQAEAGVGWQQLRVQLRPAGAHVHVRLVEEREEQPESRTRLLHPTDDVADRVRALQEVGGRHGTSSWFEAEVQLTAVAEPAADPELEVAYNRDDEPEEWDEAPSLGGTDLVQHLTRFPRTTEEVPDWLVERIAAAGLDVPEPEEGSQAGEQGSLERPEALDIDVARDTIGPEPQVRRLRLGGSLSLAEVLETAGLPVAFTDEQGSWVVRHGQQRDTGEVLGVVAQQGKLTTRSSPGIEVHVLSDAEPAELCNDGVLHLYYCSVPGDLETVLDGARLGEVSLPPDPKPGHAPDNAPLRQAVAAFADEPDRQRMLHVLRQALGGRLLLDATGTEQPGIGQQQSSLQLRTVTIGDGERGLCAFTANTTMIEFRRKTAEEEGASPPPPTLTGLAQSALAVLEMFQRTEELDWLVIDPGGPACPLPRADIERVLKTPTSSDLKDLLLTSPSLQELYSALASPEAKLYLAESREEERSGPILLKDKQDGKPVLPAFTSAVEVAAMRQDVGARRFSAAGVLRLALANGAKAVQINPAGPSATLSSLQVWHMMGRPRLPQPPRRAARDQ